MDANTPNTPTRRGFIKGSSMLLAGSTMPAPPLIQPEQAEASSTRQRLKIGLIGCGTRGTQIAARLLQLVDFPTTLYAVADVFPDRMQQSIRTLRGNGNADQIDLGGRRFAGLLGYRRLLECDLDIVISATPPGFRPLHVESAIAAGKHVFAEKPIATDVAGAARFLRSGQEAQRRGLSLVVGLQRRNSISYQATIEQLQQGAIGPINYCRAYWNQGPMWIRKRVAGQSELEYQLRNWYYFNWLGGDHIVEQHVHNLDVINWLLGSHPERAHGMGGRQMRSGAECGEIYDHHCVEYTYPNGTRLLSMCRQMPNCWNTVGEYAHGADGWADIGNGEIYDRGNQLIWRTPKAEGKLQDSLDGALSSFLSAVVSGSPQNHSQFAYDSTLTAILGRLATYCGKEITWSKMISSQWELARVDDLQHLNEKPPVLPNEQNEYACSLPGTLMLPGC